MWASSQGRDLDADLRCGAFLSLVDAESLVDFLGVSAADQEARARWSGTVAIPRRMVVPLESFRPNPRGLSLPDHRAAGPEDLAARIRWVIHYVRWHLAARLGAMDRMGEPSMNLKERGEQILAHLLARVPRVDDAGDDEISLEGVPPEVLRLMNTALLPGGPENPFRSPFVQGRNYLIWRLLLDTGSRRGEVREAKADDIDYSMRRFHIRVSKTRPRTVPIGADTAEAFDVFIERHWAKLPREARRQGYLFTDVNGRQLSLRAINRIFEVLRQCVPGVPGFASPHTCRRSWNDSFSERIDAIPEERRPVEKKEVEMRNRLQGWSGASSMGARYAKRHTRKKADEIAEALISSLRDSGAST
jgi:integrase